METMSVVCLNGEYLPAREASIPVNDYGVLYGMGLFETIRVTSGKPRIMELHLSRLFASARELGLAMVFEKEQIAIFLNRTAEKNNMGEGALRLTITGGGSIGEPGLFITGRPLSYRQEQVQNGIRVGFSTIKRNQYSPLVKHKTLNYFENILAKREAQAAGWDEGFMINTSGMLAEGAVSNIFIVDRGKVITPDLESGLLPGITRQRVIELCAAVCIDVEEREVNPVELTMAGECFITNSLMGVMPVTRLEGTKIGKGGPGEVTQRIMAGMELG